MTRTCARCGKSLADDRGELWLRSGTSRYHLACAPNDLIESASEEYQAILRKGIRYFDEKYSEPSESNGGLGDRFLALGRAVEAERDRRRARRPSDDSNSPGA